MVSDSSEDSIGKNHVSNSYCYILCKFMVGGGGVLVTVIYFVSLWWGGGGGY